MRIVGGTHRSRQFHIPNNLEIRPTTDFAKEALFNILQNRIDFAGGGSLGEGMKVLDLFGGSGSISYELASRGCAEITTIEKNPKSVGFIKKTAMEFKFENIKVICMDVFKYINLCSETFDLVFADPPFKLENIERIPTLIFEKKLLSNSDYPFYIYSMNKIAIFPGSFDPITVGHVDIVTRAVPFCSNISL